MRIHWVLCAAIVLALSTQGAFAQGRSGGGPNFKTLDKNNDGEITADELADAAPVADGWITAEELLGDWDEDADGSVSEKEFNAQVQGGRGAPRS
jgi:hypothetical protein